VLVPAGLSAATGLYAALRWYLASTITIKPLDITADKGPMFPDPVHEKWIADLMETASRGAALNKTAAIWTAISVVFSATLMSLLPQSPN
jgi:hypothetical protein